MQMPHFCPSHGPPHAVDPPRGEPAFREPHSEHVAFENARRSSILAGEGRTPSTALLFSWREEHSSAESPWVFELE